MSVGSPPHARHFVIEPARKGTKQVPKLPSAAALVRSLIADPTLAVSKTVDQAHESIRHVSWQRARFDSDLIVAAVLSHVTLRNQ